MSISMRVGLYVRVSTQEQAMEGYSIGAQTDRLTNFCKARDWIIHNVYTDGGFSGSNIQRPALQQLIKDIENHTIDCVLVYKLDRLSRSQKDTLFLIEDLFLKNNVEFVSLNENFDTSTPFGRAMIGILSVFAQLEREQIKERMLMGRTERAKNGYWHGGGFAPFGYDYINGELIINEFQAMQVREIYNRFLADISLYQLTTEMNEKYKTIQHESTVRSILTTPLYYGIIRWNNIDYKGKHKAIIDKDLFDKVQRKINSRKWKKGSSVPAPRIFQSTTLLGGLLYCANCGARYFSKGNYSGHGKKKRYYPYYYCYSRAKTNKRFTIDPNCKNPAYAVEKLDAYILSKLKELALNPKQLDKLSNKEENKINFDTEIIKKRISELDAQIARMLDLYQMQGNIPLDIINARMNSLQDEKNALNNQLSKLQESPVDTLSFKDARKILDSIDDYFDSKTLEFKKRIIHSLIKKIVVLDKEYEFKIYWNF